MWKREGLCVTPCSVWLSFFLPSEVPKLARTEKIIGREHTHHREKPQRCDIAIVHACSPQQDTPRINQITRQIIGAAMKVHTALGPGLLESAYRACLLHELRSQGFKVASEVGLPVLYLGEKIDLGYRIDLIVADSIIIEIKCVEAINPVHKAQLLSYMRL